LSIPGSTVWLFFTLMYFFTETDAIPTGKWEFLWRFFAGPFNFLFSGLGRSAAGPHASRCLERTVLAKMQIGCGKQTGERDSESRESCWSNRG